MASVGYLVNASPKTLASNDSVLITKPVMAPFGYDFLGAISAVSYFLMYIDAASVATYFLVNYGCAGIRFINVSSNDMSCHRKA